MRISDWSSDVCSSDLLHQHALQVEKSGGNLPSTLLNECGERIRECDGRSVVNCIPDFGRSFISYISGGFRASWPGSDNQLLDRDLRKADLHPSTGPCPLTTRFDSGHFLIGRSDRSEDHTTELKSLLRVS